jgi:hypothetical protein
MENNAYILDYQQSIYINLIRKGIIGMFKIQKDVKKQQKGSAVKVFLKRGRKKAEDMNKNELSGLFDEFNLGEFQTNKERFIEEMLSWPTPLPGRAARAMWRVFASCTLGRFASSEETAKISTQAAKIFQLLRDKHGCIMLSQSKNTGEPNTNSVCYENGVVGHKIIGAKSLPVVVDSINIKLSAQQRSDFIGNRRCYISFSKDDLEIDDRTPRKVMLERFSCNPPVLDIALINSGKADGLFQILSSSMNARKREICAHCLSGKDILIPEGFRAELYKKRFDNYCYATKSCKGCFWFNSSITQDAVIKEVGDVFNKISATPGQLLKLKARFDSLR